jgi:PAS domain S-box-containing protein
MSMPLRSSGIGLVGDIPWGTHLCHFFETKEDLLDTVLPYLKAGLQGKEKCVWVVATSLTPSEALKALRRAVPRCDRYLEDRSIEIIRHRDWYGDTSDFHAAGIVSAWEDKLGEALERGFTGLRVNGTAAWRDNGWRSFCEYEEALDASMAGKRMIALCTYPLAKSSGDQLLDVARTHQLVVAKRDGRWQSVETPALRQAKTEIRRLNRTLQQRVAERTAELTEAETRFAKAFQASPVALAMSTIAEGRIIDVNERWLEVFGYDRAEVLGRTNRELNITADPEIRPAIVKRFAGHGVVRDLELQVRRKSGEIRDLIVSAVRIALLGEEECWLSSQLDITDRKRAEHERDQLLESERAARTEAEAALERLHAIESITDGALRHLGLDELLSELLARLQRALATDAATVFLLSEDGQSLYHRASNGYEPDPSIRVRVGSGVTGMIVAQGRPLVVDDYSTVDVTGIEGVRPSDLRDKVGSVMGVPLRNAADKVVGVVVVSSKRARRFTAEELQLMGLVADRVAPAIEMARLVERVRGGRERQRVLARRLFKAQEEERRRLAVELHDELGQVLTAVKINLGSLERAVDKTVPPHQLRDAIASVDQAMQRVRDLALDLRPSVLDDLGLAAALRWYFDRFARGSQVEARAAIDPVPPLEAELETACFRVAQEAMTNVARHARARHVWLELRALGEGIELGVRDDGIGFDVGAARERAAGGTSMGLLGMQERVSLVGGELEIVSAPGRGTAVRALFGIQAGKAD